jgi:hypothetical protein
MANLFEAVATTLKSAIDGENNTPLHTGEVTNCWLYYTAMSEALRYEEAALNTTEDDELIEMLKDAMKVCKKQLNELGDFMKQEGIPFPPLTSPKPDSNPDEVPMGVKQTDNEISNGVSIKLASMVVDCAVGQSQSIRDDFGLMMVKFQAELIIIGATLKQLMKKRGWIKIPPYYYPPGHSQ